MEKHIEIPESITNMIRRLELDAKGYKDIIIYILSHNDLNISDKQFDRYQEQYLNANAAFEYAKAELAKKYITNKYKSWNLNYYNNTLTIIEEE